MPPARATITDVARLAGVSTSTAGRVLGGYGYASEEIRLRVRQSAEQLAYRPNLLARGLITGKTKTIGVIPGDIQSPFYASIIRAISDESREKGFGLILTNSDDVLELELEAMKLLREKQVDGLIVAPCDTEGSEHLRRAVKEGLPVVQIDRTVKGLAAASVTVDHREASRRAVDSLITAGHQRIAVVAELESGGPGSLPGFIRRVAQGTLEPKWMIPSWQRLVGYIEAHNAAALEIDLALIARVGRSYSLAQARRQVHELLSNPRRPTALFAAGGLMSAGAIQAISELNIAVPDELSLIGYDDLDWMSFVRPGVTTVAQPVTEIGRAAARLMLESLSSAIQPLEQVVLPTSLVWRGSVMPAPAA